MSREENSKIRKIVKAYKKGLTLQASIFFFVLILMLGFITQAVSHHQWKDAGKTFAFGLIYLGVISLSSGFVYWISRRKLLQVVLKLPVSQQWEYLVKYHLKRWCPLTEQLIALRAYNNKNTREIERDSDPRTLDKELLSMSRKAQSS
jgi:hypothetical protein